MVLSITAQISVDVAVLSVVGSIAASVAGAIIYDKFFKKR